jgi:hypothetical protein
MKIENNVIVHYSGGLMYDKEREGKKNNVVEVITNTEYVQMSTAKSEIKRIHIINEKREAVFTREITDISIGGRIGDYFIIVITWKVEP